MANLDFTVPSVNTSLVNSGVNLNLALTGQPNIAVQVNTERQLNIGISGINLNAIYISGPIGPPGPPGPQGSGVSSVNLQTGVITIYGTGGNLFVTAGNGKIYISGSGLATSSDLLAVSGYLSNQIASTGSTIYNLITGLSGFGVNSVALSGYVTGQIAAVSGLATGISGDLNNRLIATGQNLYSLITGASGANISYTNSVGNSLSGNLAQTGANLLNTINVLSGNLTGQIYNTGINLYNQLYNTGQILLINQTGISGALNTTIINTGNAAVTHANGIGINLSGNLQVTGSSLYQLTTGVSGYLVNLITASAGGVSSLNGASGVLNINGLGNVSVTTIGQNIFVSGNTGDYALFALKTDVTQTGIQLITAINSLSGWTQSISGVLAQSIYQTGSVLSQAIANLTGQYITTGQTGQFYPKSNPQGYATSGNLANTGAALTQQINYLSGFTTGISGYLQTLINSADANVNAINGLTGNIFLTGTGSVFVSTAANNVIVISGQETNLSGYLTTGQATGLFYPLSENPSGYVTGDYYTKDQINNFFLYQNPFYFSSSLANDASGYQLMTYQYPSGYIAKTGIFSNVQNNQYLTGFITPSGEPGINGFIAGISVGSIHAWKSNVNQKDTSLYYHLFKVTTGNNYELLSVSSSDTQLNASETHLYFNAFVTGSVLAPSDRIAVQWFASVNGGGTDPTIYLTWSDDTMAAVTLPYSAALLNNTFYPNTNPSGFITTGQTGQFYPASNPQGYATSGNLAATGFSLYNLLTGFSGEANTNFATKTQLTQTGVALGAQISSLSGYVNNISGVLDNKIIATGNAAVAHANSIGSTISGNLTQTGATLIAANLALSGAITGRIYQTGIDLYNQLYNTGQLLFNRDASISGGLQTQINNTGNYLVNYINSVGSTISGNLTQTGQTLFVLITGLSGDSSSIYATKIQLTQTGVTLGNQISSLSGFVVAASGALDTKIINTGNNAITHANGIGINLSGNLTQTGVNLTQLNLTTSGALTGRIYQTGLDLYNQLYNTGQLLFSRDANISGGLQAQIALTGANAIAHANGIGSILSGNLTTTGQTLFNLITGLSGDTSSIYATKTQLTQTGILLNTQITGLSGLLSTRIDNTGIAAINYANGIGTILSGNLTQTGITLIQRDNSISGYLQNQINNLVNSTGTLLQNVVYTSGVQFISGTKYFIGNTYIDNLFVTGTQTVINTQDVYVGNNWMILNSTGGARDSAIFVATGFTGMNATGGVIGFDVPSNTWRFGIGGYMTDLASLPQIASLTDIINASGGLEFRLAQTGAANIAYTNSVGNILSGNLTQTGVTLSNLILTASGTLTGRIYQTGIDLYNQLYNTGQLLFNRDASISGGLQTQINATGASVINHANSIGTTISGNLTQTGVILINQISSLSGYSTGLSGALDTKIVNTGNAAVAHANGIGVIISGNLTQTGVTLIAANLSLSGALTGRIYQTGLDLYNQLYNSGQLLFNRDASISGGLQAQIIATGNSAVAHANSIGNVISGNLTQTGVILIAADLSLSGALTGRIYQTGLDLYNQLYNTGQLLWNRDASISGGLQTQINATGNAVVNHANSIGVTISGNLTQTGVLLGAQIAALSGYTTGIGGGVFSYLTGLNPTGFDSYYINFPVVFPSIPRVSVTMELGSMGNGMYGFVISGRSTTGFWALLTDTVDTSGVFLDVLVKT